MAIQIYVDEYSGYKANERPRQFCVDEERIEIANLEKRWRTPNGEYFQVRSDKGKRYVIRYSEIADQWTLQSDFDGAELLARTSVELVKVDLCAICEAESRIAGCE